MNSHSYILPNYKSFVKSQGQAYVLKLRTMKSKKKTAQEIQDEIFRKMPADKKMELGSQLWRLAKELVGEKINYGTNRSQTSFSRNRKNS